MMAAVPLILGSIALAFALRVPLSLLLQRFVTTDADLSNAEVGWVERANPADLRAGIVGFLLAASTARCVSSTPTPRPSRSSATTARWSGEHLCAAGDSGVCPAGRRRAGRV